MSILYILSIHTMSRLRHYSHGFGMRSGTRWLPGTEYRQNGDKLKRLQVQSKRINLLSSTIDLFRVSVYAYSAEQVLLNKRQIYGSAPKVNCYHF